MKTEKNVNIIKVVLSVIISFFTAIFLIILFSKTPGASLHSFFIRPFSKAKYIWNIVERMIPIIFTGLAVCIIFSANEFNLASEGAFYGGAFVASMCAIYLNLPIGIHTIVCIIAATLAGTIILLIPSILELKFKTSVMVISLMINYIILNIVLHFLTNVVKDKSFSAISTKVFQETAVIPKLANKTSYGIIIALVIVIVCWFFLYKTKLGYKIRMVGHNKEFSKLNGIKVGGVLIISQLIGGAIAGMGGAVEILGYHQRFKWTQLPGYGWTGIIIAILAKNNPLKIPFAAFFLAYLEVGCEMMQIYSDMQPEMIDIIKTVVLLLFASKQLLNSIERKNKLNNRINKRILLLKEGNNNE